MITRLNIAQTTANILVAIAVTLGTASAESVSDFYRGKTLTFLVGSGYGGSYDLIRSRARWAALEAYPGKSGHRDQVYRWCWSGIAGCNSNAEYLPHEMARYFA